MRFGTVILLVVLLLVGVFAALNWAAFVAPVTLSLVLTEVQAPLGLLMLGLLVLVLLLFLSYTVYLQTTVLLDGRSQAREMQALRQLAEQAEASRLSELRAALQADFRASTATQQDQLQRVTARIDVLERELRLAVDQSGNSLAASLGEMDDRLRRLLPASAQPPGR